MTQVTPLPQRPDSAWRLPAFRRVWAASTVSTFGSEMAELAMPLLALLTLEATAAQVSGLRIAQFLPFLLATLPLGLLVDRHSERRLSMMVAADAGRFVLFAALPIAIALDVARIELLIAVVFAAGILTVLYQIADFALLPSIVPAAALIDANGKLAASSSANEIGGRGLGGLLIQATSAPIAIAVDAVSYLGSALLLRGVKTTNTSAAPESEGPQVGWRGVAEGLRYAVRNRHIRALVGEAATFNLFNEVFILGLLLYAVRQLDLGAAAIGLVFTAGGIGSFVGSWFGARVTRRFGYGRVLVVALVVGNTAPLGSALLAERPGAAMGVLSVIFAIMGVGIGVANVHAVSLRQSAVAEQLRGRVNAAYRLISWGAIPVGAAIGGAVASGFGARTAMIAGAAGMSTATLWVAFSDVRRLRTIDDASADRRLDSDDA